MVMIFCKNRKCRKLYDDSPIPICPHCGREEAPTPMAPCDMCDGMTHRLTKIDSGHSVCDNCLQEFAPPDREACAGRVWAPATQRQIAVLRRYGLEVKDDATIFDCWKFEQILLRRRHGLADDILYDDLYERVLEYGLSHGGKWESYCETYVAGGKYLNSDGTSRLDILRRCRVGETLKLVREPENPHQRDLRAIKVCRETGEQVGYVPIYLLGNDQNLGFCLAKEIDEGDLFHAILTTIAAKDRNGHAEFGLNKGDLIGEVIASCERQPGMRFDTSTVTARMEVYRLDAPYPCVALPLAPSATEIKAIQVRTKKLRKQGGDIPDGATIFDCWKQEQILLRRKFELADDASHDVLLQKVHESLRAGGGKWEFFSDESVCVEYAGTNVASQEQPLDCCWIGEQVTLVRQRHDARDFHCIDVISSFGEKLGSMCVSKRQRFIAAEIDNGTPVMAEICDIAETDPDRPLQSRHVEIRVSMFVVPGWKPAVATRRKRDDTRA